MNDMEFLDAFHDRSLPATEFRHEDHLRLAWLILNEHELSDAAKIVTRELKRFAVSKGDADRYHETLTRFWLHIVNHAKETAADAKSIDELLERFPILLNKALPFKHWSSEVFNSVGAKSVWVPPDPLSLP